MTTILVTGGAGFIGSHLVDALIERGDAVTVFDNLEPQVHGESGAPPAYLNPNARFIKGDVCDGEALKDVIAGHEVIFHQAARVGVGQSMYQIARYMETNTQGTANLFDIVVNNYKDTIKKIVVASSMSIYGEGLYICSSCGDIVAGLRSDDQMAKGHWEQICPLCGKDVKPSQTPESKPLDATSVYALSKKDQEELTLMLGKNYGIPTVALRYFNVYGPRQALSNPYTGVCAIFSARLKNDNPPIIYEDGLQSRDFVSVYDIVAANILAMEKDEANYQSFNIGTGKATTILDIANVLARLYGKTITPLIERKYRAGDIRHCVADITKAKKILGYTPRVRFEKGMEDLVAWGKEAEAVDTVEDAIAELKERGLSK
ncbi:MAG: GDP-mannose 4,6-dehydratase [Candidatus Omnitrophica bacterium]|nr:GDP-mannose 4,6-dehydratase [Candidatus Omnitrophota bacterium]